MTANATITLAELNKHMPAGHALTATNGGEGDQVTLVLAATANADDVGNTVGMMLSVSGAVRASVPTVAGNGLSIVWKQV